jgi:hypothetical protein
LQERFYYLQGNIVLQKNIHHQVFFTLFKGTVASDSFKFSVLYRIANKNLDFFILVKLAATGEGFNSFSVFGE